MRPWLLLAALFLGAAPPAAGCVVVWDFRDDVAAGASALEHVARRCPEAITVRVSGNASAWRAAAAAGVDGFLAPRLAWRPRAAREGWALARAPRASAAAREYERLLRCAIRGGDCASVRVAADAGGGNAFFGMHMSGLARRFEGALASRAPALAVAPADWGYGPREDTGGAPPSCAGLGCYFLPSTTCSTSNLTEKAFLANCEKRGASVRVSSAGVAECRADAAEEHGCWAGSALEDARSRYARSLGLADALYSRGAGALLTLQRAALRPNARAAAAIDDRVAAWKEANPAWAPSAGSTCAALHVRHGDKLTPVWLKARPADAAFDASLEDYVRAAGRVDAVLLMTDDRDIVDAAPAVEASLGVRVFHVEPGRPLQSTSRINRLGLGLVKHQGGCGRSVRAAARAARARGRPAAGGAPPTCALDYLRDPATGGSVGGEELIRWFVAWRLMADCDTFVGRPAQSLFARFVFVFLCLERGGCPRLVVPGGDGTDAY